MCDYRGDDPATKKEAQGNHANRVVLVRRRTPYMVGKRGGKPSRFEAELNHFSPLRQKLLLEGVFNSEVVASKCVHDLNLGIVSVGIEMMEDNVIDMNGSSLGNR